MTPVASPILGASGLGDGPGTPAGPAMRIPSGLCLRWQSLQLTTERATPCFVGIHRRSVAIRRLEEPFAASRRRDQFRIEGAHLRFIPVRENPSSGFDPIGLSLQFF